MENKLQELTNKLYEEGLSKGRNDADRLIADAEAKAKKIVADAEEKAQEIAKNAAKSADEYKKNAMTELALASKQAVSALKDSIANMIVAKTSSEAVKAANAEPKFVKEMLLAVATNWNGAESGKVTLSALLPADWQTKFEKEFSADAQALLSKGVEVGFSDKVKNGFKIGEKDGGYYISFTDADFDALLGEFLKDKVAKILYAE